MTPEKVKCWNCMMTFRVERPHIDVPVSRCSAPNCGKRFWAATTDKNVRMGVFPVDADSYTPVYMPDR